MKLRLGLLAVLGLVCLYAVVPDVLAQVLPGQLVTVGCGKVVSCEPLNVTGLNTPTPLPTCPAGQLLVGPGEPGSTCATPQPTSTPQPTETPRPTDTPIPADTLVPTATPRSTDTPIPPAATATPQPIPTASCADLGGNCTFTSVRVTGASGNAATDIGDSFTVKAAPGTDGGAPTTGSSGLVKAGTGGSGVGVAGAQGGADSFEGGLGGNSDNAAAAGAGGTGFVGGGAGGSNTSSGNGGDGGAVQVVGGGGGSSTSGPGGDGGPIILQGGQGSTNGDTDGGYISLTGGSPHGAGLGGDVLVNGGGAGADKGTVRLVAPVAINGCVLNSTPVAGTYLEATTAGTCVWGTPTPRPTDTPIPAPTLVATATPELYLQATTSTPGPSTYLFYAGTPGPAIWVTPVPPTPRPTDTPIPAVNTATPIPAPTLAPTFAVGIIAEGNGGQGLQAGVAALTTATPIAAGFLYDSAGGAGSVLSFVTAVPTATIIATATPRATDTPIPTPTAVGGNPAGVYTVLMQSVTGTSVSTTKLFPGWGLNTLTSTESAHQAPMPLSLHVGQLCITTTTTETTGLMSYDIRSNGSPLTTGTMIANGSVAGNYCVSISTTGFTQGQLLSIGLVNSTGTGATVSSVSVGLSYP